jgi:hypothetical protein
MCNSVKGHQDDTHEYTKLPLEAQLKVDADHKAGSYYHVYLLAEYTIQCV